jgi:hypothetical protein
MQKHCQTLICFRVLYRGLITPLTRSVNGDWYSSFGTIPGDFATLAYKLPGQGASSAFVKIEGISCQATPSQTMWTVYFTDSQLFGFVLDSEYNGVLGGDWHCYERPKLTTMSSVTNDDAQCCRQWFTIRMVNHG